MNKNIVIFIVLIAIVGLAIYFFPAVNRKHQWYEYYSESSNDPYTSSVLAKLLSAYYPGQEFHIVRQSFAQRMKKSKVKGTYFFIGEQYFTSEEETDSLLAFVARGNTAFIASKSVPRRLFFDAFPGDAYCSETTAPEWKTFPAAASVKLNWVHPDLKTPTPFEVDKLDRYGEIEFNLWHYIPGSYICDSGLVAAGTIEEQWVNFAYLPYGKGRIYFHTTPLAFTNYHLLMPEGKEYFDAAMSHLPQGDIYYDVSARMPKRDNTIAGSKSRRGWRSGKGPLAYILQQKPLAASWYTLFAMGILFALFRGKRKQRVIPIQEKNENSSLIFVRNIGDLYFQKRNNKNLCLKKFLHFKDYVRTRYGLHYRKEDPDFVTKLAAKSGISKETINLILTIAERIEATTFTGDETTYKLVRLINEFYTKSK